MPKKLNLTPAQREVIARLGHGLTIRRAGAYGDVQAGGGTDRWQGQEYAWANVRTLETLERDGLIEAGEYFATYRLTGNGQAAFMRMRKGKRGMAA